MTPRVYVGIPQPELTDYRFTQCLWNLLQYSAPKYQMLKGNSVGSVIAKNRNNVVDMASEAKASHLLMIDSDQTFPANGLERLLNHDKDIVGATTCRRVGDDLSPVAEPIDRSSIKPFQQLVPMKLVGFPFMLIKMSVFEKMRKPYFADPPRWMMATMFPSCFEFDAPVTATDLVQEDDYFCINARRLNYEVLCDMTLSMEIGHIASKPYFITQNK